MSLYQPDWSSALADVTAAGVAVTFTPPAGSVLASQPGVAISRRGSPIVYEALALIESDALTLVFVPATFGVLPSLLGYTVSFAGQTYLVKSVQVTAPDGNAIVADVVVSR